MFRTEVVENIKTHILCPVTFFFLKSCRLCNYVEKYSRAGQAADNNMVDEHCMGTRDYRHTLTEYIIIITAFPQQQWLHEGSKMLRYTCIACLSSNFELCWILLYWSTLLPVNHVQVSRIAGVLEKLPPFTANRPMPLRRLALHETSRHVLVAQPL